MAESHTFCLQQTQILDPKSLLLFSQFSDSDNPNLLQLTTDTFIMERGPQYEAYALLRESKLRLKHSRQQSPPQYNQPNLSPPKKQVKFQPSNFQSTPPRRRKPTSVLAQSVPDFSSAMRKENRKPTNMLPPVNEKSVTPPAISKSSKMYTAKLGGSKSVNSGDKRFMARKSYASVEELKGLSSVAASAIKGEKRGVVRPSRGGAGKNILSYRQC